MKRMSKKSRTKGAEGERELARILEGERTSMIGKASPDVTAGPKYGSVQFEVKRRAKSFTTLYLAMEQAYELGNHLVAVRDDRQEWLVVMPLSEWMGEREQ